MSTRSLSDQRSSEFGKYALTYQLPGYGANPKRIEEAVENLLALPRRGTYLDVSCGRGLMMRAAEDNGFSVTGTEVVHSLIDGDRVVYAEAHALPFADRSFDVVAMFDVIEHLFPGDDERACKELARVAKHHIIVTANNREAWLFYMGDRFSLHINVRPYEEWDRLFREWFKGEVTWVSEHKDQTSETWRIDAIQA